jgi:uncharacterized protein (TIGR02757 family)
MGTLKEFLEENVDRYNRRDFIETDPINIPHQFSRNVDIEIAAFLTASIAWGQRKTIIKSARELMRLMENKPFSFIMNADDQDFYRLTNFCHRTFNGTDTIYFLKSLRHIYNHHGGLRAIFEKGFKHHPNAGSVLVHFRQLFFELPFPARTTKHVADVTKGASAKRLNMFLRWMVRRDDRGVDFGIWTGIDPSLLHMPLDLHTGRVARELGLLSRNQNDWQAVCELTQQMRQFDPYDPVKYDFALFGLGVFEATPRRGTLTPLGWIIKSGNND